jgi:hypothetical protein
LPGAASLTAAPSKVARNPERFSDALAEALKVADVKRYVEWRKLVARHNRAENDGDGEGSGGGMAGGPT